MLRCLPAGAARLGRVRGSRPTPDRPGPRRRPPQRLRKHGGISETAAAGRAQRLDRRAEPNDLVLECGDARLERLRVGLGAGG